MGLLLSFIDNMDTNDPNNQAEKYPLTSNQWIVQTWQQVKYFVRGATKNESPFRLISGAVGGDIIETMDKIVAFSSLS